MRPAITRCEAFLRLPAVQGAKVDADDLASLMLDLLMSENTKFKRSSANPLLFVAVAEEQAESQNQGLVDPAAQ